MRVRQFIQQRRADFYADIQTFQVLKTWKV